MDTRRDDEPAWTTHARRILPGQEVRINRDDDAEEGDLGMRQREKPIEMEEDASGGSSDSRTLGRTDDIEMQKPWSSGSEEAENSQGAKDEEAKGDREIEEDAGERTPPLAEYREGPHLIIERKRGDGEEVSFQSGHVDVKLMHCRSRLR